jgi:hypothetical protein
MQPSLSRADASARTNTMQYAITAGFRFALLFFTCAVVCAQRVPLAKHRLRTYLPENFLQTAVGFLTTKEGRFISAAWEPKDPDRPDASCYVQRFAPPGIPPLHCSTGGYDPCPATWKCSLPFWSRPFTVYIGDTAYDILNKSADVLMPEMNSEADTYLQQARAVQSSSPGLSQSVSTFSMESRVFHPYKNRVHGRQLDFSYGYHHGVYTEQSTYFVSDPDVLYAHSVPFAERNRLWPLAEESMLVVDDFASIEALAARIIDISTNETLFDSYLAWKDASVPQSVMDLLFHGEGNVMCRACARHWDFQWKKLNGLVPEPDPLWWSSNSTNWKGP